MFPQKVLQIFRLRIICPKKNSKLKGSKSGLQRHTSSLWAYVKSLTCNAAILRYSRSNGFLESQIPTPCPLWWRSHIWSALKTSPPKGERHVHVQPEHRSTIMQNLTPVGCAALSGRRNKQLKCIRKLNTQHTAAVWRVNHRVNDIGLPFRTRMTGKNRADLVLFHIRIAGAM